MGRMGEKLLLKAFFNQRFGIVAKENPRVGDRMLD
jgi:hypothetical protein